jgi:hypothetical protein
MSPKAVGKLVSLFCVVCVAGLVLATMLWIRYELRELHQELNQELHQIKSSLHPRPQPPPPPPAILPTVHKPGEPLGARMVSGG